MTHENQVSNTYFSDLLSAWVQYGHDKAALVEGAGVSVSHIENPLGQVSLGQFRQIMQNAVRKAGIDGFALRVGQQITPNAHGALGLAFLSSDTVDSALKLLEKYAATQTDLVQFALQREPHQTRLVIEESRPLGEAYVGVIELALSTLWFALRFLSAGQLTCQRVHLRYPLPAYATLYRDIFQCPVEGNQAENAIHLSHRSLSLPLVLANPQALRRALSQCESELEKSRHQESLATRIQKRLLRAPGHWPALPQLCEEFALSERTLRRRLDDENTSYQQLLNDTRRQLAERYLRTTDHSVHEIAWLLGYNDPSNFGNAFKRWYGMAPSEFREWKASAPDPDQKNRDDL